MRLAKDLYITEAEYGFVILDAAHGTYWTLNPTGTVALRTLLKGGNQHQAAQTLIDQYEVDYDTATTDVSELVAQLTNQQIILP